CSRHRHGSGYFFYRAEAAQGLQSRRRVRDRGVAADPGDVEHLSAPALVQRDHCSHLIFFKSPSTALKSRSPVTNSVFLVFANAAANASARLIGWEALNRAAMSASSRVTG